MTLVFRRSLAAILCVLLTVPASFCANGDTTASNGVGYAYDFENHLIQAGRGISYVYDGDGNRRSKTVGGVTTTYVVADENPTGYAQVLEEDDSTGAVRQYTYALDLLSRWDTNTGKSIYYVKDGHGSVRALTDQTGAVTDTYDYDAYGNLIHSTGATTNNYLYSGEQLDPDLNLYYHRARYLNTNTGRFWSMDSVDGTSSDPASLHKYLYTGDNPVNRTDPSGHDWDIGSTLTSAYISVSLAIGSYPTAVAAFQFASAALTLGLFATDEDFRAVYLASGGNPAQALAEEFSTLLDEAGPTIAKEVIQDAATTDLSVGARFARTDVVKPGERFVRVAAKPEELNFIFKAPGGARGGTYAFPEDVFAKIGEDPMALKDAGDLPKIPAYYRIITPPPGTAIQRGVVPGKQYGGRGGIPEVFFPEDF